MKHLSVLFILILAILSLSDCSKKERGYAITVKFNAELPEFKTDTRLVLSNKDHIETISDTAEIVKGVAIFSGIIASPDLCSISTIGFNPETGKSKEITKIFLENATYTVSVPEDEGREVEIITDAPTQKMIDSLFSIAREEYDKAGGDTLYRSKATGKIDTLKAVIDSVINSYIAQNPNELYTLYQLALRADYLPLDSLKRTEQRFLDIPELANSKYIRKIRNSIDKREDLRKGGDAPDFKIRALDKPTPIQFQAYCKKNKFTLLQFWATTTPESRRYNLILRRLHSKFRWKGFSIVGVSLDTDSLAWRNAIYKEKLYSWLQTSDFKGWGSEIAKKYFVHTIPTCFLIDSLGKIVMANPNEEELNPYLEEALNFKKTEKH